LECPGREGGGRVPLPAQITIEVLPKIDLRERYGPEPGEQEVYDVLVDQTQRALDALADERDLPVVGTVGSRTERGPGPTTSPSGSRGRATTG